MLTDRQLLILQVIVDDFIRQGQPVGSRALSKKEEVTFSPATIRNEMADLEELGFIEKTHTSSGRVPSEKGYRYYVDHLLAPERILPNDLTQFESLLTERMFEFEAIAKQSAQILSELTSYTAIALGPTIHEHRLKKIQIVPLQGNVAVAIIVLSTGRVENKMITLPPGFELEEVERLVNILNERLVDVPLHRLEEKINLEVLNLLKQHIRNYESIYQSLKEAIVVPPKNRVFVGGKMNVFSMPEFADIEKARALLQVIEQKEAMSQLIRPNELGIQIKIGKENNVRGMEDCSLITASYSFGPQQVGSIAILGPTRMEYSRVVSLLNYFSHELTNTFSKWYEQK